MFTKHDLVLNMLAINSNFDFAAIRGYGWTLSFATNETLPNGKTKWRNHPQTENRLEELQFLYDSHVNALEYFVKGKVQADKESAAKRLATLHIDYAPFMKVQPYNVPNVVSTTVKPTSANDIAAMKAKLMDALMQGQISAQDFVASVALLGHNEPVTSVPVQAETPKQTNKAILRFSDKVNEIAPLPKSEISNNVLKVTKGKLGYYYVNKALLVSNGLPVDYDKTFAATIMFNKDNKTVTGTWIITNVAKDSVTITLKP